MRGGEAMLPQAVRYVLERLEDAGFAAYAVGGCVRDTLLGRTPGDWDVTTRRAAGAGACTV
ncbi:MAG: hypothetical protein ACLUYZ_03175 [Lachnospiraceae bacterium]